MAEKDYSPEYIRKIVAMLKKHEEEMNRLVLQKVICMDNDLTSLIKDFLKKEKINFSISEDSSTDFWLDNLNSTITVKFKINAPKHEILYDVYSPEYSVHLKEETIKDVERLEFLAEENRRWKIAESIEDIWLVLDQIKFWARKNNFSVMEKQLL